MISENSLRIAVIGSGPCGLMVADVLASAGVPVTLFEKRKSSGRKLLIAGSSGLNISYDCPRGDLLSHYRAPESIFSKIFSEFSQSEWIRFVESLGLETFKGTSRRFFVREMKASGLLKAWTTKLKSLDVEFEFATEVTDFDSSSRASLHLKSAEEICEIREFDAICFCLGGGSWEPDEIPLRWPSIFQSKGIAFTPFAPSNAGFEVDWPLEFLKEAEGLPLKSISLTTSRGIRKGELMVTEYGLEGTPVYSIGAQETVYLDLKPGLTSEEIHAKLNGPLRENLSPFRRIKKVLNLSEASQALLFHLTPASKRNDLNSLISLMKKFPISLKTPRPLSESISSSGGIAFSELTDDLMLRKFPGVFAAGEMLDWDAPTGGFLIQACVSQGRWAGQSILKYLKQR